MSSTTAKSAPRSKRDLFATFSILSLQGFGGVLSIVHRELVEKKRWLTEEEFVEDWAVAQILPGPNVVNLSLMIGDRSFGTAGALTALSGMLLLPLLIVVAVAVLFTGVAENPAAQGLLRGMGAVAAGLIAGTGLKLMKSLKGNVLGSLVCWALVAITFVAIGLLRVPLVWVLLGIGGCASLWAYWQLGKLEKPQGNSP